MHNIPVPYEGLSIHLQTRLLQYTSIQEVHATVPAHVHSDTGNNALLQLDWCIYER